jgi:hypothetical protein
MNKVSITSKFLNNIDQIHSNGVIIEKSFVNSHLKCNTTSNLNANPTSCILLPSSNIVFIDEYG